MDERRAGEGKDRRGGGLVERKRRYIYYTNRG